MTDYSNEPVIDLLCDLIRRPSVTPDDAGCQQVIAERLTRLGFECETLQFNDVSNLWARRGSASPLLCFAGHTDVVPPGDDREWDSDPFEPCFRDRSLFGRGAADMKASLAAMIVAVEKFIADHADHRGSIAFLITSDEEGRARDGTLKVVEKLTDRNETIDWCVLGEPSSRESLGDMLRIGRRGSLSGTLTIHGVQGHVAYPDFADNPIRRFAPLLAELHAVEWDRGNEHFPPTSFQVVQVESSAGAPNVTPGNLDARFNFRYSTEWLHTDLQDKMKDMIDSHEFEYTLDWHLSGEPFLTRTGTLSDAVTDAVAQETGHTPELSTGGGTSDGRFISPAGADVIELGPVNASIHKVNEHVNVDDVIVLRRIYEGILKRLLL